MANLLLFIPANATCSRRRAGRCPLRLCRHMPHSLPCRRPDRKRPGWWKILPRTLDSAPPEAYKPLPFTRKAFFRRERSLRPSHGAGAAPGRMPGQREASW